MDLTRPFIIRSQGSVRLGTGRYVPSAALIHSQSQKTHKVIHEIVTPRQTPSGSTSITKGVCIVPNHDVYHYLPFSADGTFNPFPNFGFSGLLRPVYPLSPKRVVPDHIPRPDYAEDGSSNVPSRLTPRNTDSCTVFKVFLFLRVSVPASLLAY